MRIAMERISTMQTVMETICIMKAAITVCREIITVNVIIREHITAAEVGITEDRSTHFYRISCIMKA